MQISSLSTRFSSFLSQAEIWSREFLNIFVNKSVEKYVLHRQKMLNLPEITKHNANDKPSKF